MEFYQSNQCDVMAINYDFMPTSHESSKELWLQLKYPAPKTLLQGSIIKLKSTDVNLKLPSQTFQVLDISGTRVTLKTPNTKTEVANNVKPFTPGNQKQTNGLWHPLHHSPHW